VSWAASLRSRGRSRGNRTRVGCPLLAVNGIHHSPKLSPVACVPTVSRYPASSERTAVHPTVQPVRNCSRRPAPPEPLAHSDRLTGARRHRGRFEARRHRRRCRRVQNPGPNPRNDPASSPLAQPPTLGAQRRTRIRIRLHRNPARPRIGLPQISGRAWDTAQSLPTPRTLLSGRESTPESREKSGLFPTRPAALSRRAVPTADPFPGRCRLYCVNNA
jgi:hypothetical protein